VPDLDEWTRNTAGKDIENAKCEAESSVMAKRQPLGEAPLHLFVKLASLQR
jgi:hypothetical protein